MAKWWKTRIYNRKKYIYLPVIGEPPVSFGSDHVRIADSWRMLTTSGGAGASGASVVRKIIYLRKTF